MVMKEPNDHWEPLNDGVDHINVYSKAATHLGRMLTNFAKSRFEHSAVGSFASMEAYYYYVSTGKQHEELKQLYGYRAKVEGRKYVRVYCEDFDQVMLEGLECKVLQNPYLATKLMESDLPLVHYYVYGGKAVFPTGNSWLVEGLTDIRDRLKNGVLRCPLLT